MNILKKLMIGAAFVTTTFGADPTLTSDTLQRTYSENEVCGIRLNCLPAVQAKLAQLKERSELFRIIALFNEAVSTINRDDRVTHIKRDPKDFLLSEGDFQTRNAIKAIDSLPLGPEEKEHYKSRLTDFSLMAHATYLDGLLTDVQNYSGPFVRPLLGVLSLIAGRGASYTGCGASDDFVSQDVRSELFAIFEQAGLLAPELLEKLRAPYDVTSEVRTFLETHPNVGTLVIAGSHVGLAPEIPYDPNRKALVVNLDPARGADIVAKIADTLPHLPTGQFNRVIDDSNFSGGLLKDIAAELFRAMKSGGTIEGGPQCSISSAYSELTSAGFDGVFKELIEEDVARHYIESIGSYHLHQLDLDGLKQFLGEENYSNLVREVLLSDEAIAANLFPSEDTLPNLTEEAQGAYFTALRKVYEQISDASYLLANVKDGTLYLENSVFIVKDGKIHRLEGFVHP